MTWVVSWSPDGIHGEEFFATEGEAITFADWINGKMGKRYPNEKDGFYVWTVEEIKPTTIKKAMDVHTYQIKGKIYYS